MKRFAILVCALLIVSAAAFSDQPQFSPRDPGAARKDGSNITSATWRTKLDVYSTSESESVSEPAGAIATHAAVIETHGMPTLSGNAGRVLAVDTGATGLEWIDNSGSFVPLSGSVPMTGSLKYNADTWGVHHAASDTAYAYFSGGSAAGSAYGSYMEFFGNQHDTYAGAMRFTAGNVASGTIKFYTDDLAMTIGRTHVVDFAVNPTIGGVDVIGDISAALDGILGE